MLDKSIVVDNLSDYDIDDIEYIDRCLFVIDKINNDLDLYNKFMEIYNILYVRELDDLRSLWKYKDIKGLFGVDIPFITNVILLMGECNNNFDDEQVNICKKRVRECLVNDIYNRGYDSIRVSQMLWGVYFIRGRIIEIGRLQYELYDNNIKIHIPGGKRLIYDEVIDSLKKSRYYIKKYFNLDNCEYYCNSWLLSLDLRDILDNNSNIIKFQSLFDIEVGDSCVDDILNFVFDIRDILSYNELKEETTLKRGLKKYLLESKDIKMGLGKLKKLDNMENCCDE